MIQYEEGSMKYILATTYCRNRAVLGAFPATRVGLESINSHAKIRDEALRKIRWSKGGDDRQSGCALPIAAAIVDHLSD